jgi:ElaB/YqjD/DUF883 family membrane-anchored ribosome-binding protein
MDSNYGKAVEDQVAKAAREVQGLGDEVKKSFGDAVSHGRESAGKVGDQVRSAAEGARDSARDTIDSARRRVGQAAERVTVYADDNTALVAGTAFGIGLLIGFLVSRRR